MAVVEHTAPTPGVPAAGATSTVHAGGPRQLLRLLATVAVGVCVVLGVYLLVTYPSEVHDRAAFNAARKCGTEGADPGSCWAGISGTIVGIDRTVTALGAHRNQLLVSAHPGDPPQRIDVVRSGVLDCAAPGDTVDVAVWNGAVTSVYTPHGQMLAPSNMNVQGRAQLQGGVTLLAIGLVVPTGVAIGRHRRARGVRREPLSRVLQRPSARLGLILFGAGQIADVVTSAVGDYRGLYESNPLVADFVRVVGPAGFLLFRLPAIILFLVGVWYLPRRLRLLVLYAAAGGFLYIGAHNVHLAFAAASPAVCGAAHVP